MRPQATSHNTDTKGRGGGEDARRIWRLILRVRQKDDRDKTGKEKNKKNKDKNAMEGYI